MIPKVGVSSGAATAVHAQKAACDSDNVGDEAKVLFVLVQIETGFPFTSAAAMIVGSPGNDRVSVALQVQNHDFDVKETLQFQEVILPYSGKRVRRGSAVIVVARSSPSEACEKLDHEPVT